MKILANLTGETTNWMKRPRIFARCIQIQLEANTMMDQMYIATHRVPPLYASGVRYQEEPLNIAKVGDTALTRVEEFALIPAVIERGWGDCFPAWEDVVSKDRGNVQIRDLLVGEEIWGLHDWTRVEAVVNKGILSCDRIYTSTKQDFALTPGHKVYVLVCHEHFPLGEQCSCPNGRRTEVRSTVEDLQEGMVLVSPYRWHREQLVVVEKIDRESCSYECVDVQTSDHRVYLPEHDVTVSNCDDLAPWLCAELRERGVKAKIRVVWRQHPVTGQVVYHIVVRLPDGTVECPSSRLGMPLSKIGAHINQFAA